jgi:ferric-dicitrate binding protein FerR (iron transport regulator)
MQEERFWSLASLKLSGEASPEELAELNEWLDQDPDRVLRLEVYTNIWRQKHPGLPVNNERAYNRHLQRLSNHLAAPVLQYDSPLPLSDPATSQEESAAARAAPRRWLRPFLIAMATAAAVMLGALLLPYPFGRTGIRKEALANNTVSTRPGSRSKIQLPDGTQVWLNSDSRLTYNQNFPGESREVQLTGEAYFDVAKDKNHPFLIHTSAIDIKVLGTSFNVRSYENEKNTETALFQGSVQVSLHNNPEQKILLRPNQKLTVQNSRLSVTGISTGKAGNKADEPLITLGKVHFQKKDSSITETLWIKNQLAFNGASLDEVALQLERWYGVKVHITDDRLNSIHYTAVFEDESLAQVMEALRLSGNFKYAIHKKEVTITP